MFGCRSLIGAGVILWSGFAVGAEGDVCRCCGGDGVYAPWVKGLGEPVKREGIGECGLVISTDSEEAKVWFGQGVALLHCFWEFEAYRSFLEVVKADPECAMGYWGIAMSLPSTQVDAKAERDAALALAKKFVVNGTAQEKLYVEMLEGLNSRGTKGAVPVLERIVREFPDDAEARGFLAYWVRDGYDRQGKAKVGTRKGIAILEEGLKRAPGHVGLKHYLVHLKEAGPDYAEVLEVAEKLLVEGRGSSHLVHMPGHIYFLMGDYGKACEVFRRCYEMEVSYFKKEGIAAVNLPNFLHNIHYWAVAEAERGELGEAIRVCGLLGDEKAFLGREGATAGQQFRYLKRTLEAEIYLRFREYGKAAGSIDLKGLDEGGVLWSYGNFLKVYAEWMGMRGGAELDLLEKSAEVRMAFGKLEEASAKVTGGSEYREVLRAGVVASAFRYQWLVWKGNVGRDFNEIGVDAARDAEAGLPYAEPPFVLMGIEESIGWLALEKGEKKQAKEFFGRALKQRRKSWHVLRGLSECE